VPPPPVQHGTPPSGEARRSRCCPGVRASPLFTARHGTVALSATVNPQPFVMSPAPPQQPVAAAPPWVQPLHPAPMPAAQQWGFHSTPLPGAPAPVPLPAPQPPRPPISPPDRAAAASAAAAAADQHAQALGEAAAAVGGGVHGERLPAPSVAPTVGRLRGAWRRGPPCRPSGVSRSTRSPLVAVSPVSPCLHPEQPLRQQPPPLKSQPGPGPLPWL
jgi:hypothetical protein